MASNWEKQGLTGWSDILPPDWSELRQKNSAAGIGDIGIADTLDNHKKKPGNHNWGDLDDLYFAGVNILANGNFEEFTYWYESYNGVLGGWKNGGTHNETNYFEIDSGQLKIIRGGEGIFYIYQTVLVPNGEYTWTVDIVDGTPTPIFITVSQDLTTINEQVLVTSTSGSITTDSNAIHFGISQNGLNGETIIDNVTLTPLLKHVPDGDTDGDGDVEADEGVEAEEGTFDDVIISTWHRDDGSTTT